MPEAFSVTILSSTVIASGTVDAGGAPWRLYDDGTLVVDEGFIESRERPGAWLPAFSPANSPWVSRAPRIDRIIFTGPITGGAYLQGLFGGLNNVITIEGLEHFDTGNVTSMMTLFYRAHGLTSLDLSGWDTGNVVNMRGMFYMLWPFGDELEYTPALTNLNLSGWDTGNVVDMNSMFRDTWNLTSLDISGWDTRNVTDMNGMFQNAISLRQLTLGEHFRFVVHASGNAALPPVPQNDAYTGRWQNVGTGTVRNPQGSFVLTSAELMATFNGATMADTWVWQRHTPLSDAYVHFHTCGTGRRGDSYIAVPVTLDGGRMMPDTTSAAWAEVLDIGHIYGTAEGEGLGFWGWFEDEDLVRSNPRGRRPALVRAFGALPLPTGACLGTLATEGFDLAFFAGGNADIFGIWFLWGDVNDDDRVDAADILRLERFLHDRLFLLIDFPFWNVQINPLAADVFVRGQVSGSDILQLERFLHDRFMRSLGLPPVWNVVLGEEPG